jgi:predicted PurR-regulated permease PerM
MGTIEKQKKEKILIWITFFALLFLVLYSISGILLPFIAGLLVSYLLNPAVQTLEKLKIPRTLSTLLLILLFFVGIGTLLFFAIPFLKKELLLLASRLPSYGQRIYSTLLPTIEHFSDSFDITVKDFSKLKETASQYFGDMLAWGLKLIAGLLTNSLALANLLSLVILTPVVAFYLLRDWPFFIQNLEQLLPREHSKTIKEQLLIINRTLAGYIRGQTFVCLVLSLFYCIGFIIVGLDFAFTVGLITGCLAFIPYFGFLIGAIAAISIAFAQFSDWQSIGGVTLVLLIGQTLEANVLTPKLIGERIGLHPVWIIFSLLSGGILFGFLGILLAMPVAAVVGVLVRFALSKYYQSSYYLGASSDLKKKK